jgi:hypothetical protein
MSTQSTSWLNKQNTREAYHMQNFGSTKATMLNNNCASCSCGNLHCNNKQQLSSNQVEHIRHGRTATAEQKI